MSLDDIFLTKVRYLSKEKLATIKRSGIICYTDKLFMLGIDFKSKEISDFSGSVKIKKKENPIFTAMREFNEETLEIFEYFKKSSILDCACCGDSSNLIIFIHIDLDLNEVIKFFGEKLSNSSEMYSLFLCSNEVFIKLINNIYKDNIMYEKIRIILQKTILKYGVFF